MARNDRKERRRRRKKLTENLGDVGVVHVGARFKDLATLVLGPDHEGVHRPFDVLAAVAFSSPLTNYFRSHHFTYINFLYVFNDLYSFQITITSVVRRRRSALFLRRLLLLLLLLLNATNCGRVGAGEQRRRHRRRTRRSRSGRIAYAERPERRRIIERRRQPHRIGQEGESSRCRCGGCCGCGRRHVGTLRRRGKRRAAERH